MRVIIKPENMASAPRPASGSVTNLAEKKGGRPSMKSGRRVT
jgi:hypothetical protein